MCRVSVTCFFQKVNGSPAKDSFVFDQKLLEKDLNVANRPPISQLSSSYLLSLPIFTILY